MRKHLDAYYTPESAVQALLRHYPSIYDSWTLEPCCGTKNISRQLKNCITADIDSSVNPMICANMALREGWNEVESAYGLCDWVVTNPPFSHALEIAQLGLEHCQVGMALLLRLSFLEPTYKRQEWLHLHPPSQLIVLPRISFTGDGKTDSVTCAWMIWKKSYGTDSPQFTPIRVETKL